MKFRKYTLILLFLFIATVVTAHQYAPDIIVTSPAGLWTDTRAYTNMAAAIAAVGGNERNLYIVRQEDFTGTIPATASLNFMRVGSINATGAVTINSKSIIAGNRRIFFGAGALTFADGSFLKSAWFEDIDEAIAETNDDTVTILITQSDTAATTQAVGNDVTLLWQAPGNIISINGGIVVSNISSILAGDFEIITGAGRVDFIDGATVWSTWFDQLRTVGRHIDDSRVVLEIRREETLDYDYTFGTDIRLDFKSRLTIPNGRTLTIYSPAHVIADPRYFIFNTTGTGAVAFTMGGTIHPMWWGALADGSTDDAVAWQAALDAFPASGGTLAWPVGDTDIGATLIWPNDGSNTYPIKIVGAKTLASTATPGNVGAWPHSLNYTPSSGNLFDLMNGDGTDLRWNGGIEGGTLIGPNAAGVGDPGTTVGIRVAQLQTGLLQNMSIQGFKYGIHVEGTTTGMIYMGFTNVALLYNTVGLYVVSTVMHGIDIINSRFSNNTSHGVEATFVGSSVNFRGSYFESNGGSGIFLTNPTMVNFDGSHFEANGDSYIRVSTTAFYNTIINIRGTTFSATTDQYAGEFSDVAILNVTGSKIRANSGGFAFLFAGHWPRGVMSGNDWGIGNYEPMVNDAMGNFLWSDPMVGSFRGSAYRLPRVTHFMDGDFVTKNQRDNVDATLFGYFVTEPGAGLTTRASLVGLGITATTGGGSTTVTISAATDSIVRGSTIQIVGETFGAGEDYSIVDMVVGTTLTLNTDAVTGVAGAAITFNAPEVKELRVNEVGTLEGTYSFGTNGGAQGDFIMFTLPDNATITKAWYEVVGVGLGSGGAATVAFSVVVNGVNEIVTATAFDNAVFNQGFHDAIPDGAATNMTTKTTAERNVIMTIAGADLTSGVIYLWVEFVVSQ